MADPIHDAMNFSDTPEYFQASREEQQLAKENGFNIAVASTEDYKNSSPEVQDTMRTEYIRLMDHKALNSEYNPSITAQAINQQKVDSSSDVMNIFNMGKDSIKDSAFMATHITPTLVPGADVSNLGRDIETYQRKQMEKGATTEVKKLARSIKKWDDTTNQTGFFGDLKATAILGKELVQNIVGVEEVAAESSSSLAAGWASGKAGALGAEGLAIATGGITAPAIPVITMLSSATGVAAEAIPHKLVEKIVGRLEDQHLDVTEFNVNKWVKDNPEEFLQDQKDSLKYVGVLGLADATIGRFIGKYLTLPKRLAKVLAKESMTASEQAVIKNLAKESNKSVDELFDLAYDAKANSILKSRSVLTKAKENLKGQFLETAQEPLTEAIATASIGEDNTAENLFYEAIGGFGMGPIGKAADISLYGTKLATGKTGKAAKNVAKSLIPKSKEEKARAKEIKDQRKATKAQMKADRAYGYTKEVEETSPDADLSALSDPKSPDYNPIKAMDILAKSDDPQRYDDAMALRATTKAAVVETKERLAELEAIDAKGKLTERQHKEHSDLTKLADDQYALALKIKEKSDILHSNIEKTASSVEATPIENPDTATEQEVTENVTKTFGSSSSAAMTNEKIEKAINNPNISAKTKAGLKTMQQANIAIEKVAKAHETSSKTIESVKFDVAEGTDEFKGINSYKRSIARATRDGNTKRATSEIAALEKFAKAHRQKANIFQAVFNSERLGKPLSKENADAYAKMQKTNPDLNIHKGSKRLIEVVNMEADALEKSVKSAKAYVAMAETSAKSSQEGTQGPTAPKKGNAAPSIPQQKKSPEQPVGSSDTTTVGETTLTNDRIATGLIAATQIANNTGNTEWLERQIASGFLDKDQTAQAQKTVADVKAKTKNKTETKPETKKPAESKIGKEESGTTTSEEKTDLEPKVYIKKWEQGADRATSDPYPVSDKMELKQLSMKLEKIISTSKTLDEFSERIDSAGIVFGYADRQRVNKFVEDRINNKTDETFDEWRTQSKKAKPAPKTNEKMSKKEATQRRRIAKESHELHWNSDRKIGKPRYDTRLKDLRMHEFMQVFFRSQAEFGAVRNAVVDGGVGTGGTNDTVANGSVNPQWVQDLYAGESFGDYRTKGGNIATTTYQEVERAINKALIGKGNPTEKQALIVSAVLDAAEQYIEDNPEYNLDQYDDEAIAEMMGEVTYDSDDEVDYYDNAPAEEVSSPEETSESAPVTAVENLQAVDAPTKAELLEDDFGMTEKTYGEFEIQVINKNGEIEYITYAEAMENLQNEQEMFEELRTCLIS